MKQLMQESIISHLRLVRRQHGTKGTIYII